MIEFLPYRPEHLGALALQPAQAAWRDKMLRPGYAASLANGHAWTGRCQMSGRLLGSAGFVPQWPGRAVAWALFGAIPPASWPRVVAKIRGELAALHCGGYRRIEAQVARGFAPGCRLAHLLGFEVEALAEGWGPDGGDYFLYRRLAR